MRIDALNMLLRGLRIGNYVLRSSRSSVGRFIEERNYVIVLTYEGEDYELMNLKVFYGREPYYRPWIEVFNIRNTLTVGGRSINYFDSEIEDSVLDILAKAIKPGERLFIEYYNDYETSKALELGIPIPLSRLGYKLFLRGFRWFKDWYYPEGFVEGNPKIQAEKPINKDHEVKLLRDLREQVNSFMKTVVVQNDEIVKKCLERARIILSHI